LGENFSKVYTVEINEEYSKHGIHKVSCMPNVKTCTGMDSVVFLKEQLVLNQDDKVVFFLDAHWEDRSPLIEEMQVISSYKSKFNIDPPIIAIHDFYTGNPELGYDSYRGKRYDAEYIKGALMMIELSFACTYKIQYNTKAEGAKRGIAYLLPDIKLF
jgi:hypothetical protein